MNDIARGSPSSPDPGEGWLFAALEPGTWRNQVLQLGLRVVVIFGPLVYFPSVWAAVQFEQWGVVVIDTVALLTIIALFLIPRAPFIPRAVAFCFVLYLLGAWLLIEVGPISQIYLLGFSLLATLLLGLRVGLCTVALNAATLLALGVASLTAPEMVIIGREMTTLSWVAITINFLLVNTILVVSVGVVVRALEGIANREQDARAQVEREQVALMATNEALEQEMRKRAEAERSSSELETRLLATLESMTDACYLLDNEWRFTFINREAERIMKRAREELIGVVAHVAYPEEAAGEVGRHYRHAMQEQRPHSFERFDESLGIWYEIRLFPSEKSLAVYFRDITQRKRVDETLRASENRFRTVFNQQFQFMAILSAEGVVLEVNDLPLQSGGLRREEVLGTLFWEAGWWRDLPEMRAAWPKRLEEAARQDAPSLYEDEYQDATGQVRVANSAITAVRDPNGTLEWYIVQATDITEQRRSEAAARQSESLLRMANKMARLGGWAVEIPSYEVSWSDEVRAIHEVPAGVTPTVEEGIRFYAPEWRGTITKAFEACATEGISFDLELELFTAKGTRVWVRSVAQAERNADGRIIRVHGAFQDISDMKRGELERIQLETKLTTTLESITDAFFTVDREWRFTFINRHAEALLQRPRNELLGKVLWEEFPDAVGTESDTEYHRAIETHTPVEFSQHYPPLKSWFEVRAYPTDEGLAVYFRDVSAQQRASEELRSATNLLERTFESLDVAVLLIEIPARTIVRSNAAAERVFGYSAEELLGKDTEILHIDAEHYRDFAERSAKVLDMGEPFYCDFQLRHRDGSIIDTQNTVSALRDDDGNITAVVSLVRDVTAERRADIERANLEEQLRQSQKMEAIGRLAGGVAHDFNNMLSVIMGHAELMESVPDLPSDCREDLSEIIKAGQRSTELTRQLLAFARKQTIAPEILDINETISNLIRMLERLLGENIEFVWEPGDSVGAVRMDPTQIDQILMNLVVNSRDAITENGRIVIETRATELDDDYCESHLGCEPGPYVLLTVSDNGCGMDTNTLENLFEPFFTTKPVGKGTGLGLPTVYGIVQQNHGAIHVYSELGHGTVFSIYLPRYEPESAGRMSLPAATHGGGGGTETILLVEDEAALLTLGERMLTRLGYTVLAAGRPEQAIEMAQAHEEAIDLLITDVVMPGMNGLDVWQRLREDRPGLKCLFMSGYTADIIAHHGVLDHEVHFIHKPFTRDDLGKKIRDVLARPAAG